jgi:hypothetical protein
MEDNQIQPGQSDQPAEWKTALEESIVNHPSMTNIPDVPTLAKNYVNQQELIGRKGIILPKENDDNDLNRFYNQLGRPEDPTKYDTNNIVLPEDMKSYLKPESIESFKTLAHKYGLTQKQFEGIAKEKTAMEINSVKSIFAEAEKIKTEGINQLMNEWGSNYNSKVTQAKDAMIASGIDPQEAEKMISDPKLIKSFSKIGELIGGDSLRGANSGPKQMSIDDIKTEISSMIDDKESPLHDGGHRDHKAYLSRLHELYKMKEKFNQ